MITTFRNNFNIRYNLLSSFSRFFIRGEKTVVVSNSTNINNSKERETRICQFYVSLYGLSENDFINDLSKNILY